MDLADGVWSLEIQYSWILIQEIILDFLQDDGWISE